MKRSLAEKIKMLCVYGVLAIMTGTAVTACSFPGSADILFGDTSSTGAGAEDDGTTSGAAGNGLSRNDTTAAGSAETGVMISSADEAEIARLLDQTVERTGIYMGYEDKLFDASVVHTIDIVMDDWDGFIAECEDEEYRTCSVVIDGETLDDVAIRAKGNTSLSSVRSMGSERYSFKLEFDHNDKEKTYYGLDKLCLNNLIQDNTMMKDYLVYTMMGEFGVSSPLCSYVYITVNGADWGLYLAVEGVEDSFLDRNYGEKNGELYKPDSSGFGGGRGNGRDFSMDDFTTGDFSAGDFSMGDFPSGGFSMGDSPMNEFPSGDIDFSHLWKQWSGGSDNAADGQTPGAGVPGSGAGGFGGFGGSSDAAGGSSGAGSTGRSGRDRFGGGSTDGSGFGGFGGFGGNGMNGFGGMGSSDVKLQYIDDDPESYPNIFDNAKTKISEKDQKSLIKALKKLSSYEDLDEAVDMETVIRYFVVHNFVVNGDSYTGSMVHNYYLHEKAGLLDMIPWDYNLAFGTFMGGNASSSVNSSIDSPVSGGSVDDRPMVGWIFSSDEYTEAYHRIFAEFLAEWFENGRLVSLISETEKLIAPYVEKDTSSFCTDDDFEAGVEAITQFVELRAEAVKRQLSGDNTMVETGSLNLSDMGSMGSGFGGRGR